MRLLKGGRGDESFDPASTLGAAHGLGGYKNVETRAWAAPRNLMGRRIAIHAGKREPRPTEWSVEVQRVVLRRAGGSHSMPMGAVVATARLIECMRVMTEPDSGGLVVCRGFGELGDEPKYEAAIRTDPYGDFSVGRWLWVFQDVRSVEPVAVNGRQGVWTLSDMIEEALAPD